MERILRVVLLVSLLFLSIFVHAAESAPRQLEHQIKAVFLYKFADYVEWPSSAFTDLDTAFTIGVIGSDEVAAELVSLSAGHSVNGRPVYIKLLDTADSWEDLQILFIGKDEKIRQEVLLEKVKTKPVLTVTERKGSLHVGSIINFVPVEEYIRFEISVASADVHGLKISARLLNVAQRIEKRRL